MPTVAKPYNYANGQTIDANQLNQDLDTLYNLINGLLDAVNITANGLNDPNKFASEVITQAKSKGLVYTQDLYGQSWVVSGGVTTASGSPANQITVTTLIANILQADGSYRHVTVAGTTYVTSIINATYYLDLQPDGTMNWAQTHSAQANYMPIATVTSNASGNINVITDTRVMSLAVKPPTVFSSSVSAPQNPNLLFNPSFRLGSSGWTGVGTNGFATAWGGNGNGGILFNNGNMGGTAQGVFSSRMPISAGVAVAISAEMSAIGITAGAMFTSLLFYNNADALLTRIDLIATNGAGTTKYSGTGTTPAGTSYMVVDPYLNANTTNTNAFWAKIKVEASSVATTFSDDNTLNNQQYGSVIPFVDLSNAQTIAGIKTFSNDATFNGNMSITGALTAGAGGSFSNNTNNLGYQKFPGGLMHQWGNAVVATTGTTITFPVAFPTAVMMVIGTPVSTNPAITCTVSSFNSTSVTMYCSASATVYWFAIGKQ